MTINFDMDGTIANLYGVDKWLENLRGGYTRPYRTAKSMVNARAFQNRIIALQNLGVEIKIISWTSKEGTSNYNTKVEKAKLDWLAKHYPRIDFDGIAIVDYGTPKQMFADDDLNILFDDNSEVRESWNQATTEDSYFVAFDVDNIIEKLDDILEWVREG